MFDAFLKEHNFNLFVHIYILKICLILKKKTGTKKVKATTSHTELLFILRVDQFNT